MSVMGVRVVFCWLHAHCLLELATLTLPLVTILTNTMKFTTSVIAVALAVAAPSVSGTSALGWSLREYFTIDFCKYCGIGVGRRVGVRSE